jgi:hypothetical protein
VNMLSTTLPAPHRAEVSIDAHRDSLATQGGEKYGLGPATINSQNLTPDHQFSLSVNRPEKEKKPAQNGPALVLP